MKLQLVILSVFAFTCFGVESAAIAERAVDCETVFSPEVCSSLQVAIGHLKLLPATLQKAIEAAIATGETSGPALYKKVLEFLRNEVAGKDCEHFLSGQLCTRIRNALTPFNLAKIAGKLVIESILKGPPTKYEIFLRVLNLIRKEVVGKDCNEVLSEKMCTQLKSIAIKLSIKAAKVSYYVIEAIISGHKSPSEIYQAVLKFYKEEILSLECTDILSTQVCTALGGLGNMVNLSPQEINEIVKEAVLRGNVLLDDITREVKKYINKIAQGKKCEDLISASFCSQLKAVADKLKVGAKLVDEAVREAVSTGKLDLEDIKAFCLDFFKNHVSCEPWLGKKTCSYIKKFATTLGVKLQEVESKIRELIAQRDTATTEIFNKLVRFIKDKIFG